MAITSSSVPFTDQLWQYYLCALLYGLGAGAWTNANNVWLIEIWNKKSEQVLFLSQLMYGVGAIIGPLIDRPYLTGEVRDNHTSVEVPISGEERRYKLKTPFLVSGAIQITCELILILYSKANFNYSYILKSSLLRNLICPKYLYDVGAECIS